MNRQMEISVGKTVLIEQLSDFTGMQYCFEDLKTVLGKIGIEVVLNKPADITFQFKIDSQYKNDSLADASITREDNKLVFKASTRGALNHLVYTYIKDYLCAEWFLPGDEVVIVEEDIKDPFLDKQRKFSYQLPFDIATQYWGGDLRWHRRMRGLKEKEIYVSHNWKNLVPKNLFFESHPEYYALINGERNPKQLCTTNKDVIQIASEKCIEFFDKNPDAYTYSLSPNDMYGFCGCDNCRALDRVSGSITDRLMVFFNAVAENVTAKYPDKKLAFYAYLNYTDIPKSVKPHPAIIPVVCRTPWQFCHNHSLTDKKCECNKKFREILEGWVKLCPEVYIREYYGHFLWFGFWPVLHTIEDDFEYYKKIGIKGVISESHEHWGINPWVLYGAGCYLAGENEPWKKVVERYCDGVFPDISGLIRKMIVMLEEKTQSVPCKRMDLVFDEKMFAEIQHIFNEASEKNITDQEKDFLVLLEYGFGMTKNLVKMAQFRSHGDIEGMINSMDGIFDLIAEMENDAVLPVVKYKLVKRVLDMFRQIYINERSVFTEFFNTACNVELDKTNKGYVLSNWLISKCYPNKIKEIDYIPMLSPILDETLVVGVENTLSEDTKWKNVRYGDSYYSLYEFFPFRPDSVRFYRTDFKIEHETEAVIALRTIDGYRLSVDGEVLATSKKRRFSKEQLFDYYKVELSSGTHQIELLLEGSEYLEKDDFTLMLFDCQGSPLAVVE